MGRHGTQEAPPRRRAPIAIISLVVLLLAAVGLGIWWWSLRSRTDPIDASPVLGYAVVVSSPGCAGPANDTMVDLLDVTPAVRATINACGDTEGQRIPVEYLAGNPAQVRVAGTSTAGTSTTGRWLPLAILAAGVLAVGATIVLLMDRRRSQQIITSRRVSVAELRRTVLDEPRNLGRGPSSGEPVARSGHHVDPDAHVDADQDADLDQTTRLALLIDDPRRRARSAPAVADDLFTHRPEPDSGLFTHQGPVDR